MDGNVRMRGDTGPGVGVRVLADSGRLRLVSGNELVGDWMVTDIGFNALQEGFNIKAEGEEFILRTADDAAIADELGVTAVSPRLGRRLAARHNPQEPEPVPEAEPPQVSSNLAAIGFAVAGALIVLGGAILNIAVDPSADSTVLRAGGVEFWLAFIIGGVSMIAVAYVMSIGAPFARVIATVVLAAVVIVFGVAVSRTEARATELTAYGFIAGGLVVAVAVLVSGSLAQPE